MGEALVSTETVMAGLVVRRYIFLSVLGRTRRVRHSPGRTVQEIFERLRLVLEKTGIQRQKFNNQLIDRIWSGIYNTDEGM